MTDISDIFNDFYSDSTLTEIDMESVPERAMEMFEGYSQRFIDIEDYKAGDFDNFFMIDHSSGGKTCIAKQTKTYYCTSGDTEELVYLVDFDASGNEIGHAELRFNISDPDDFYKDKPFVGYTKTIERKERQGLGSRRLRMMNALSKALFGYPLNSSTLMSDKAKGLWKKLTKQGETRMYKQRKHDRFVFVE